LKSVIQWLLMPRLDLIRERLPNVRLKFLNLPTGEAVKRLLEGLIDFALVRKDAVSRPLQAKVLGVMGYSLFSSRRVSALPTAGGRGSRSSTACRWRRSKGRAVSAERSRLSPGSNPCG
jgi:hypothetical protein